MKKRTQIEIAVMAVFLVLFAFSMSFNLYAQGNNKQLVRLSRSKWGTSNWSNGFRYER